MIYFHRFSILPLPLTSTIASYDDRTDRHGTVVNRDTLTLRGGRHYTEKGTARNNNS